MRASSERAKLSAAATLRLPQHFKGSGPGGSVYLMEVSMMDERDVENARIEKSAAALRYTTEPLPSQHSPNTASPAGLSLAARLCFVLVRRQIKPPLKVFISSMFTE